MNTEPITVRCFREADIAPLVRILTANGQYDFPEVEGPEAMRRGGLCSATVFLGVEIDNPPHAPPRKSGVITAARFGWVDTHLLKMITQTLWACRDR